MMDREDISRMVDRGGTPIPDSRAKTISVQAVGEVVLEVAVEAWV